ncbi:hypothetical protein [Roseibium aggregatum]|uniref:hypothetical protein n=1 Tax=Roseibium aggregatum TaxID=187304 RepID=UPI001E570529|nr:hypothetical protein [Roseibium aggregatum]UES36712.1 hypothetical protein GFC08_01930 [Roseibium aggregatum]
MIRQLIFGLVGGFLLLFATPAYAQETVGPAPGLPGGKVSAVTLGDPDIHGGVLKGVAIHHDESLSLHFTHGRLAGSSQWLELANDLPGGVPLTLEAKGGGYEVSTQKNEFFLEKELLDGEWVPGRVVDRNGNEPDPENLGAEFSNILINIQRLGKFDHKEIKGKWQIGSLNFDEVQAVFPGLKIRLENPQPSEDTKTVRWDWTIEVDSLILETASGTAAKKNQIIFNEGPEITHVLMATDQKAVDENGTVLFPKPSAPEKTVERGADNPERFRRQLIIIGRNLEQLDGSDLVPSGGNVSYSKPQVYSRQAVTAQLEKYTGNAAATAILDQAAQVLADPEMEAYWVTADVSKAGDPGVQGFTWDLPSGEWELKYGEVSGVVSIARPANSAFSSKKTTSRDQKNAPSDGANEFFFRDEVVFEARVDEDMDAGELKLEFENEPSSVSDAGGELPEIVLKKTSHDRHLYRSKSYVLVDKAYYRNDEKAAKTRETFEQARRQDLNRKRDGLEPEAPVAPSWSGAKTEDLTDTFKDVPEDVALLVEENAILRPRLGKAHNILQLEPLPDAVVTRAKKRVSGDFVEALRKAAWCSDKPIPEKDIIDLTIEQERKLSRFKIPYFSPDLDLPVSVGDHAALIMIRARLAELLRTHHEKLKQIAGRDPLSPAYIKAIDRLVLEKPGDLDPIKDVPAVRQVLSGLRTAAAAKVPLADLYNSVAGTLDEMADQHLATIASAIKVASSAKDCDVEALLSLVGRNMQPVIDDLKRSVTRVVEDSQSGVKVRRLDPVARAKLDQVRFLMHENEERLAYSQEQWEVVKSAIGVIGIGTGIGAAATGGAGWALAAFGTDAVDLGTALEENIPDAFEDLDKLDLGKGAISVIGAQNSQEIIDSTKSLTERATDVGFSAAGAVTSGLDFLDAKTRKAAQSALGSLLESSKIQGKGTRVSKETRDFLKDFIARSKDDPGILAKLDEEQTAKLIEALQDRRHVRQKRALQQLLKDFETGPGAGGVADLVTLPGKNSPKPLSEAVRKGAGLAVDIRDGAGIADQLAPAGAGN